MADQAKVKKGGYIRMVASHSGTNPETDVDVSYSPDQVLLVGEDIPVDQAAAFVAEPADDPRAVLLDPDEGKRVRAQQRAQIEQNTSAANEIPPGEDHQRQPPPPLDPRLGEEANEEAAQGRRDLEEALSTGALSLEGLFAAVDEEQGEEHRIAGHMHLRTALLAVPQIGEVRADEIVAQLGVEPDRHLAQLGSRQREELAELVDQAVGGGQQKEGDDVDENETPAKTEEVERATSPEAETRETATPKQTRRKVTPPAEDGEDGEDGGK